MEPPEMTPSRSSALRAVVAPRALLLAVALVAIVAVAWLATVLLAPRDDPAQFPVLSAAQMDEAAGLQGLIEQYEAAWVAHDLAGIGSLLAEDDFLFVEPGTRKSTKQAFLDFMEPYVNDPEHVGGSGFQFHVGHNELVETYLTWGFGGATEQDPLVQADLFGVRDGKIHLIQAMYGARMMIPFLHIDPEPLIRAYAEAWSSGDRTRIEALYSATATRSEQLYGVEQQGSTAIGDFAEALLRRHPGFTMTVQDRYIFGDAFIRAAVLTVGDGRCQIPFTILLEVDDAKLISRERVYYDLVAIKGCDWQR